MAHDRRVAALDSTPYIPESLDTEHDDSYDDGSHNDYAPETVALLAGVLPIIDSVRGSLLEVQVYIRVNGDIRIGDAYLVAESRNIVPVSIVEIHDPFPMPPTRMQAWSVVLTLSLDSEATVLPPTLLVQASAGSGLLSLDELESLEWDFSQQFERFARGGVWFRPWQSIGEEIAYREARAAAGSAAAYPAVG